MCRASMTFRILKFWRAVKMSTFNPQINSLVPQPQKIEVGSRSTSAMRSSTRGLGDTRSYS